MHHRADVPPCKEVSGSHPGAAGRQGLQKCQGLSSYTSALTVAGCQRQVEGGGGKGGGGQAAVSQRARFLSAVTLRRGCHLSLGPGGSSAAVTEQRDAIISRSQRSF